MRRIYLLIVLCCTLLVAGAAELAQPARAHAQAGPTVTILVDRLNVRSGPGTTYRVVGGAASGERYSAVGQSGGCAWLQIAKGGRTLGWVSGSKSYVKLTGACSAVPAAAVAAPAAGQARQGCALLTNQLQLAVKLGVQRSDGWQGSWSIAAGSQTTVCVDPGSYTATFTAAGLPGSMAFPFTVKGGEYYEIPLSLPGS